MVESSDLQSAIQRTQAMERLASIQNQQEELNRKRFELEMARQNAERAKKAQDVARADTKRVVRDRYDGDGQPPSDEESPGDAHAEEEEARHDSDAPGEEPPAGGGLDVRV